MHNRAETTCDDGGNGVFPHTPVVLVAEDSESLRTLITCQLRALGYTVLSAADGLEAQELAGGTDGKSIDMLITDRNMPRMCGDELVRWFQQEKPDVRVIIMSTCGDSLPEHTTFLQKPFTLISLHRTVRETFNDRVAPGTGMKRNFAQRAC